ncbi:putative S-protein [Cardamine amara subsp. amara]|uniref:S-protein homolog n=1 Tax=Cardamine amara subsp. amara TaxID=228776 RepID=A0ABD0ZJ69_CARAN
MISSTYHYFIFVLVTYLVVFKMSLAIENISIVDGDLPFPPKHVMIINTLLTHGALVVHCRNKGKDLGFKAILYQERFNFSFRVNLRRTTTYTCTFSWPENTKTFDIFRVDRDDNPKSICGICRECIWLISESGPCRARRDGGPPYCFSWAS